MATWREQDNIHFKCMQCPSIVGVQSRMTPQFLFSCALTWCQRPRRTSAPSAPARRASASRAPPSTGSSPTSCARWGNQFIAMWGTKSDAKAGFSFATPSITVAVVFSENESRCTLLTRFRMLCLHNPVIPPIWTFFADQSMIASENSVLIQCKKICLTSHLYCIAVLKFQVF